MKAKKTKIFMVKPNFGQIKKNYKVIDVLNYKITMAQAKWKVKKNKKFLKILYLI